MDAVRLTKVNVFTCPVIIALQVVRRENNANKHMGKYKSSVTTARRKQEKLSKSIDIH